MTASTLVAEPGTQSITMSRVFNAPRELVFKIITSPEYVPQWWGPRQYTTTVDSMEVRDGGKWRYIQRNQDGQEFAFHGIYHSINSPERIVDTFEFEGMPGHVLMETLTLEALTGDRTLLTVTSVFQSVNDSDSMLNSGMEQGASEAYDRLAELLAKM